MPKRMTKRGPKLPFVSLIANDSSREGSGSNPFLRLQMLEETRLGSDLLHPNSLIADALVVTFMRYGGNFRRKAEPVPVEPHLPTDDVATMLIQKVFDVAERAREPHCIIAAKGMISAAVLKYLNDEGFRHPGSVEKQPPRI